MWRFGPPPPPIGSIRPVCSNPPFAPAHRILCQHRAVQLNRRQLEVGGNVLVLDGRALVERLAWWRCGAAGAAPVGHDKRAMGTRTRRVEGAHAKALGGGFWGGGGLTLEPLSSV
eukprot:60375-Prymnesium_polylepis.1